MKQEKTTKILGMILLILIIVLIAAISFFGILRRNLNSWENILPDYELSRELDKMRVLTFSVDDSTETVENDEETSDETSVEVDQTVSDDEEISEDTEGENETSEEDTETEVPVNPEEILTNENYDKTKDVIEKRLADAGITDSEIVVDYESGDINIYVPFDDSANSVVDYVVFQGDIEFVDTETGEVLMTRDMFTSAQAYSSLSQTSSEEDTLATTGTTYDLGLQLNLTNDGINKLAELTKTYIDVVDEDGESDPKTLDVQIDGETVYTTYFDPSGTYTELHIPIYSGIDESQYDTYRESIYIYETNINSGSMPIKYVANYTTYLENNSNKLAIIVGLVVSAVIIAIMSIYLIVKNKGKGLLTVLAEVGYIAVFLLLVRFAHEPLTVFALISIFAMSVINYVFIVKMLKDSNKSSKTTFAEQVIDFALKLMPIIIVAIVFVFATSVELKSVGTVLFWGLLALIPYNLIFTNNLFNIHKDLKKIGGKK